MTTDAQYDMFISAAAREYRAAVIENDLKRTEATQLQTTLIWSKLCWMLDAKVYGWNPETYEPES